MRVLTGSFLSTAQELAFTLQVGETVAQRDDETHCCHLVNSESSPLEHCHPVVCAPKAKELLIGKPDDILKNR